MIKVPARIRYAIRTMVELAKHDSQFTPLSAIEKKQHISAKFAKQILQPLEKAGLVVSRRGVKGGYRLNKEPADISLMDIFICFNEKFEVSPCIAGDPGCERIEECEAKPLWEEMYHLISGLFRQKSLKDLLHNHG
jgi:Rrf2 family protein